MLSKSLEASIRQLSLVLLFLSCLSVTVILSAQESEQRGRPSAEAASNVPSLHVNTRLVEVNVIVNDKHGNPMVGLKQNDFSVLDNGKPQKISVFSVETNLPFASSRTPLPPGTFTNRPEELTNIPASVTVILLDALNTEAADQTLARKQVIRVLREIQPQEYVALYWLGDALHILHDFTTDASVLQLVLADYDSKSSRQLDNSELADPSLNTAQPIHARRASFGTPGLPASI